MSNVPKGKRNESKIAFDNIYRQVYKDACNLVGIHFGASVETYNKYQAVFASTEYQVMKLVKSLLYHIRVANSIYPTCIAEYEERRINQDKAIGVCFAILTEYQLIMELADSPQNKYVEYVKNIQHEINSIKKWRQSDNNIKKSLLSK